MNPAEEKALKEITANLVAAYRTLSMRMPDFEFCIIAVNVKEPDSVYVANTLPAEIVDKAVKHVPPADAQVVEWLKGKNEKA